MILTESNKEKWKKTWIDKNVRTIVRVSVPFQTVGTSIENTK